METVMEVKVDQGYMIDVLVQRLSELTVENAALKSALAVYQQAEAPAKVEAEDGEPELPLE
jgi:hypothetical protein